MENLFPSCGEDDDCSFDNVESLFEETIREGGTSVATQHYDSILSPSSSSVESSSIIATSVHSDVTNTEEDIIRNVPTTVAATTPVFTIKPLVPIKIDIDQHILSSSSLENRETLIAAPQRHSHTKTCNYPRHLKRHR